MPTYTGPVDLSDAVVQQLIRSPCAGLFGDTWDPLTQTGMPKFFCDYSQNVAEPYAVILEVGESYEFQTPGPGNFRPFLADGTFQIEIFASPRNLVRSLGVAVCQALNDADAQGLQWSGDGINGQLHAMRMMSAFFRPIPATAPGLPTVFARVITFQYQYQGSL